MEMDLKTLPGRGSPASVSLEEGYKDSETRITLSDTQSALVLCTTFELLGQIPWSLCRPLDCTDGNSVSQACGTNTIWAGRAVPFCRVWSKLGDASRASSLCSGLAGCLTASGSQGALGILVALLPHWVIWLLGRASSHLGLPSFTSGLIW